MTHRAYAKINLGLLVHEKRPDGYHNIETVFHRIDVFDDISFEPSTAIEIHTDSREAPGNEENICYKAARILQERLGIADGVRIRVTKRIPVGAGLGGGSSDAGTVLLTLPAFWGKTIERNVLAQIALVLGSDVPFFLGTSSALGKGRGEELQFFDLRIPYTILLCNPNIHIATAWAYTTIVPKKRRTDLQGILTRGMRDASVLRQELANDFEGPVFAAYPAVGEVKSDMLGHGAVYAAMSGSGSSVFGFFASSTDAVKCKTSLSGRGHKVFLTPPNFAPEQ